VITDFRIFIREEQVVHNDLRCGIPVTEQPREGAIYVAPAWIKRLGDAEFDVSDNSDDQGCEQAIKGMKGYDPFCGTRRRLDLKSKALDTTVPLEVFPIL
jgi:hypothetical protein